MSLPIGIASRKYVTQIWQLHRVNYPGAWRDRTPCEWSDRIYYWVKGHHGHSWRVHQLATAVNLRLEHKTTLLVILGTCAAAKRLILRAHNIH